MTITIINNNNIIMEGKGKSKINTKKSRKILKNPKMLDETIRVPSTAPSSSGYKPIEVIHEDVFESVNDIFVETLGCGITDEERKEWNKSFDQVYKIMSLMCIGMKMTK